MNRITFPATVYPLQGDVTSQAGNQNVKVTGLQGVPLYSPSLVGGEKIEYNPNTGQWESLVQAFIQVNGHYSSDDNIISVNVSPATLVNGA